MKPEYSIGTWSDNRAVLMRGERTPDEARAAAVAIFLKEFDDEVEADHLHVEDCAYWRCIPDSSGEFDIRWTRATKGRGAFAGRVIWLG